MKNRLNIQTYRLRNTMHQQIATFRSDHFWLQMRQLFRRPKNPEGPMKIALFWVSFFGTAVSFGGALLGYIWGYNRILKSKEEYPRLYNLPLAIKVAMAIGIAAIWLILVLILFLILTVVGTAIFSDKFLLVYFLVNFSLTLGIVVAFRRWRGGIVKMLIQRDKEGTTRWAKREELSEYTGRGWYLGGSYSTNEKLHILTCACARSGKGTNIVIPNILRVSGYEGSMVVLDIKGEAASICARVLREQGKNVVILNPFQVLSKHITGNDRFNPLSIVLDKTSPHLIDDVQVIAEMIVPMSQDDKNAFFTDSSRNVVAGLLLHLATSDKVKTPTLTTLWEWLRLSGADWDNLLVEMHGSKDPINGLAIRNAASEIAKQMASEETFGSIISHALQCTSFIQSHALQDSMQHGFDPAVLSDGNTVVFVVIPPDKLSSHYTWLRLVMTTLIRAVVRKPNKRVTFLIDEAAQLKYMSEIPTALAAYAGYNITMHLIYQDLAQMEATYGTLWRSILANCSVQHFFGINDNMTAEYVSEALGVTTRTIYSEGMLGDIKESAETKRMLQTPDEVKRLTKNNVIMLTNGNYPTYFPKRPYYQMPELKDGDRNLYDPNPYIEPKNDSPKDEGPEATPVA